MSYIDKQLLNDEEVLFKTSKHWVIFLPTLLWLIITVLSFKANLAISVELVPGAITVFFFILNSIDFFGSEYAITNRRLMMKEGFVWRKSVEIVLSSVARSELKQSALGRALGFGEINVFGFGGSNRYINIRKSAQFQHIVQQQLGNV